MTKKAHTRLGVPTRTVEDWEEAALDVIAARGIAAVSIPELARTLDDQRQLLLAFRGP